MGKYDILFRPITVNGMTIKNRLSMPVLHHQFADENGMCTEKLTEYYAQRAAGGVGLIIFGVFRINELGTTRTACRIDTKEHIASYKVFTDRIHSYDCKICGQIFHNGRSNHSVDIPKGQMAVSSSDGHSPFTHEDYRALTIEEIHKIINDYAAAASHVKEAGFDAVEIIACTGYLIPQFLSELVNHRTDEYGGSFDNRCRFAREVVAAVRAAVGDDYPVIMRIAGNDFMEGGGGNEEAIAFAKEMEKCGVDMLNVTGGWHESRVPQITGDVPKGGFAYLWNAIHHEVKIPVIGSNRMSDPDVAESILALDEADMLNLGRVLVCDPEWPNKVKSGHVEELRKCVACNQGCLANSFFHKSIDCILNGFVGKEYIYKEVPVPEKIKNILVVGGGVAGCEFAYQAAKRGHMVSLWEKSDRLGGQMYLVAKADSKKEFRDFIFYQESMLKKYNVSVVLGKDASAEEIASSGFDAVVVCTGSRPRKLNLDLSNTNIPVYTAHEYLSGITPSAGPNALVIGGGSVGCELALALAETGSLSKDQLYFMEVFKAESPETIKRLLNSTIRKVTVVDIVPKIGKGFDPGTGWPVMMNLKRLGVNLMGSTTVKSVKERTVVLETTREDGSKLEKEIPCDTILMSVGSIPNAELFKELEGKVPELYQLGDSKKVGRISTCTHEAVELAMKI